MAYVVKEQSNFNEPMENVEYLNAIGVRYITGKPLGNLLGHFIEDKLKKIYLVPTGMTNPNRDGGDVPIYFYSFCKDDLVFKVEVIKKSKGNVRNQNIEIHLTVSITDIPKNILWSDIKEEISNMLKDALIVEAYDTYGKPAKPE